MKQLRPLQSVSAHLGARSRGPEADALLQAMRAAGVAPASADLVTVFCTDGSPPAGRLEWLALRASKDEFALIGLVHLLRPGLEAISRRLGRSAGIELDEAEADVLAAAWDVLRRRPPPGRRERLGAIWCAARRARLRGDEGVQTGDIEVLDELEVVGPDGGPLQRPDLLEAAAGAGVLSVEQAELIARTRIDGEPLRALAQELGRPYDALRMERRRAEAALRTFALRYAGGPS